MAWPADYDDPGSWHSERLRIVQREVAGAVSRSPASPVRLLSLCAGEGRDVIGVLADHPRASEVQATLVELDPTLADRARAAAAGLDAGAVDVRTRQRGGGDVEAPTEPEHVGVLGPRSVAEAPGTTAQCRAYAARTSRATRSVPNAVRMAR